ncbi:hypothetical protein DKX38_015400 [Salix brachista]|uniref:Uncharacterized protein n=1 Tax=Salix brachista TaxID=2182728 RepID=A0A5N5L539_9ROSI|nr:hypothetical protein DKX38_015400 [Salix brachista]
MLHSSGVLIRRAEMHQDYMKPWLYHPIFLWDRQRIGNGDEHKPLDIMIHPCKAETTNWLVEEVHRRTSTYHHVAKLLQSDQINILFVDSISPQL